MLQIGLFCTMSLSGTILIGLLKEKIKDFEKEIKVMSFPLSEVLMVGKDCDCILLSPQARFNYQKIKKEFSDEKLIMIPAEDCVLDDVSRIAEAIKAKLK